MSNHAKSPTRIVEPPVLYAGQVVHLRRQPRRLFKYRLWMLAVDLDDLDSLARRSRLFRHNQAGIISLHDRDHGPRNGAPLRPWAEQALAIHELSAFSARLRLITMPRIFGYAFNPLSFYFCYDKHGQLGAILYQVKNTFGDQITYLAPSQPEQNPARHRVAKRLHVSPFFDMQGGYDFTIGLRPDRLAAAIAYRTDVTRLAVTMKLAGSPFSDRSLLKLILTIPLVMLKVILAIHWQALCLFLSGVKFHNNLKLHHDEIVKGSVS